MHSPRVERERAPLYYRRTVGRVLIAAVVVGVLGLGAAVVVRVVDPAQRQVFLLFQYGGQGAFLLLLLVYVFLCFSLRKRLRQAGGALCTRCGYDLRQLAEGAPCPECGRPRAAASDEAAHWRRHVGF